ncbi:MAG TPA: hypothetical protein VK169_21295 [Saprospiraceae bacterium]|nr:hypothetical protein [Saprospiraceae bacterium]
MSKKVILERYLKYFEPYYLSKGYARSKKVSSFFNDGCDVFLGPDAIHPGSISLRPKFKVTNIDIQNILEKVFPTEIGLCTYYRVQGMEFAFECDIYDDKITYSSFNNIMPEYTKPDILSIGNYYYSIEEDTDLSPILEDHKYFMEKVTFPLFDKMSTTEGIDSYLNDRIMEGDMDYFMSENRQLILKKINQRREILSGIIAAKLVNNPYFDSLLLRIKTMWQGNNYILDDVDKLIFHFENNLS